ncbi:DNA recombination protein RmuC [Oleiharenicola lentus]|jgi:DNA recombination protein RmuC|uniref:DNA recombination protein RmuC n=1 Tax=Oleiharenicola lentus TaxID=2508720 RepID=A0A4V1M601_9BACT|nr:DNA recombination protein RmuC [Oleiharenicola lentus]RXK53296.1 DNA recombination protein RmuC [Oleiharenicola lentus]
MVFLYLLLGLVIGAALGWFIARSQSAILAERARLGGEQLATAQSELATLRAQLAALQSDKSRLDTLLTAEREALARTQTQFTDTFKALAADALRENRTEFIKHAGDSLVKPIKESLEKVDTKILALEKARQEAYGSLSEQLKGLANTSATLQSETTKLSRSLRSTSTAGRWGEIQLQRVVELAGMVENVDFIQQAAAGDIRPDMIIRLPGGKSIAVDAKAPMQAYLEALEAADENVRKAKFTEHARAVRGHIDALGNKAYWRAIQPAPEFVVLFIPGEAFYSAALRYEPDLFERGTSVNVILASPATLIALLKAAAYGWKQEALSKNADEIRRLGLELHERVASVGDNLDTLGQRLTQAVMAYNSTVSSVEGRVLVTGRKLEKLGGGSDKKIVEPRQIEETPKALTAPEFKGPSV